MVKLNRVSKCERETILDFFGKDEFFGESAMRGGLRGESAVAVEDLVIMEWELKELSRIMVRCPELGGALLCMMADKMRRTHARIESMAIDHIPQRLIKVLLRLGEEFGEPDQGKLVHVRPITHELLAKYVGASREVVTQHMSELRWRHLVKYDRSGLYFDPDKLKKWLRVR